ncbi:hypothetical protein FRC14_005701 [Serendipita sp. 396]|nr:hypothetical protein FRC14_005701 [Serendipita sp. 396]KAG8780074.1 hypothetical protein FRC15_009760 [Serendipita sp. 397]KAG8801245.1 hypothetical protein FRC16_000965 [Serendipita sp. 398]KAG8826230.1 hypothetical protein FRC19_009463 [Serendipita sp. 401]KAG8837933.1 hypothetical protein FRC18_007276 [Serendipita sp. 400]KAG8858095.1 hypothetical protein FRB91_010398 [Serendipita sp. 411]KAG8865655.1 hypothetical protein FRC20_009615 [Serendipita sp. 405]KAG9056951.1 hypothetical prot
MPPRILPRLLIILISAFIALAEDFECKADNNIAGHTYDLTTLNVAKTVERTRQIPPSSMLDSIRFNICADLPSSDLPEHDQCPTGTRACLTKTNKKNDEKDRIVAVVPLATTASLSPQYEALSGESKGLTISLHGPAYPEGGKGQTFKITLLCGSEQSEPTLEDYLDGTASVRWQTPAACAKTKDDSPPDTTPEDPLSPPGNGLSWFFLLFFLSFGAYFAIGAYRNYTLYGASGWDLVPHRDFWREVPILLRDLGYHLLNTVRSGTSRGGYHAV